MSEDKGIKYYIPTSFVKEAGYNVYYNVIDKGKMALDSMADLHGGTEIEKKLMINPKPFKHKSAANQFAKYKAKDYSVNSVLNHEPYLTYYKDYISVEKQEKSGMPKFTQRVVKTVEGVIREFLEMKSSKRSLLESEKRKLHKELETLGGGKNI